MLILITLTLLLLLHHLAAQLLLLWCAYLSPKRNHGGARPSFPQVTPFYIYNCWLLNFDWIRFKMVLFEFCCVCFFFFFLFSFFAHPIYNLRTVLISPSPSLLNCSRRNSDAGSLKRLSSPLPTTVRAFFFFIRYPCIQVCWLLNFDGDNGIFD